MLAVSRLPCSHVTSPCLLPVGAVKIRLEVFLRRRRPSWCPPMYPIRKPRVSSARHGRFRTPVSITSPFAGHVGRVTACRLRPVYSNGHHRRGFSSLSPSIDHPPRPLCHSPVRVRHPSSVLSQNLNLPPTVLRGFPLVLALEIHRLPPIFIVRIA